MDLESFHRGVYGLMMAAASTIASALPVSSPSVSQPFQNTHLISSVNITTEKLSTNENSSQEELLGPPVPSPTPVVEKAVLAEKKEEVKTATTQSAPAGSLNPEVLFQLINEHRAKIGMSAYQKDERLCKLAQDRAPELQKEIFGAGVIHQGLKNMDIPYWVSENIAGYNSEQVIFNFWMSDYIHKKAIEGDYQYSCGACVGSTCAQEFSSFILKKS